MAQKFGITQVHDGENAQVDIVFLHGLRGDMTKTWAKDGVIWPRDLLPKDVPNSRIFLFGYDTGITHRNQPSVTKTEIHSDADDLCTKLLAERSSTKTTLTRIVRGFGGEKNERPIILIAHSLGGLVAAQVLVHGDQRSGNSGSKSISQNIRGMIFLGTPFRGSAAAKPVEIARRILDIFGVDTQQHTLKLLGVDSERLNELTRAFPEVLNKRRTSRDDADRIDAFFFYETLKTSYGIGSMQIVEIESALLPGCGDSAPIRADHIDICKFKTDKDEGYSIIVAAIKKVLSKTSSTSSRRGMKSIHVPGNAVNVANDSINIYGGQTNHLGCCFRSPDTN